MRHFDIVPADARLAADLNIRQDDNVFCIERIFFAGEQPYAREFSYIPCAICPELHAQQVQSLGLYNSLKKYNIIPTRANEKLKAILLDQETAGMLDQRQNDAAIYLTRITYHNNVVIEKTSAMSGATCSSILWNSPFVDHIRQKGRHKRGGLLPFLRKKGREIAIHITPENRRRHSRPAHRRYGQG